VVDENRLYSVALELVATQNATLPAAMGRQVHALFLCLIRQFDSALNARLHGEPNYRPFTVSTLRGGDVQGNRLVLCKGQSYYLRVTLLDSGAIWEGLQRHFLEASPIYVSLDAIPLRLNRILMTPAAVPVGWIGSTDWNTLAMSPPAHSSFTMHFNSPTAFSLGEHQFELFPKPQFVWGSLLRTWNRYAPECFRIEKQRLQEVLTRHVTITSRALRTQTLHFPTYVQKGFVGRCSFQVEEGQPLAEIAALTAFAPYAGVGYKTTMGMGQTFITYETTKEDQISLPQTSSGIEIFSSYISSS
jgi:CRISPR-associated endoribonuclease Cas6